jgi:hypothetical protein
VRGVEQPPDLGQVAQAQRRDGGPHPRDLADHVAGAAPQHVVGETGQGVVEVGGVDVAQRVDSELARRLLAGRAALAVLAVVQAVLGTGVGDKQDVAGCRAVTTGSAVTARAVAREVEGHLLGGAAAAVEQQCVVGPAEQRRRLVHAPGGRAGHLVLGAHAGRREPRPAGVLGEQPQAEQVAGGGPDGALERRRARQAGAHRHRAVDGDVEPAHRVALGAQGPQHPGHVGPPALGSARPDVGQPHLDQLVGLYRPHPKEVVGAGRARGIRALGEGDRQHQPVVVVGVLADQVDPARRRPDPLRVRSEHLAVRVHDPVHAGESMGRAPDTMWPCPPPQRPLPHARASSPGCSRRATPSTSATSSVPS